MSKRKNCKEAKSCLTDLIYGEIYREISISNQFLAPEGQSIAQIGLVDTSVNQYSNLGAVSAFSENFSRED